MRQFGHKLKTPLVENPYLQSRLDSLGSPHLAS
jgi:hypothetical protein